MAKSYHADQGATERSLKWCHGNQTLMLMSIYERSNSLKLLSPMTLGRHGRVCGDPIPSFSAQRTRVLHSFLCCSFQAWLARSMGAGAGKVGLCKKGTKKFSITMNYTICKMSLMGDVASVERPELDVTAAQSGQCYGFHADKSAAVSC
jgi:hypothetical protein